MSSGSILLGVDRAIEANLVTARRRVDRLECSLCVTGEHIRPLCRFATPRHEYELSIRRSAKKGCETQSLHTAFICHLSFGAFHVWPARFTPIPADDEAGRRYTRCRGVAIPFAAMI